MQGVSGRIRIPRRLIIISMIRMSMIIMLLVLMAAMMVMMMMNAIAAQGWQLWLLIFIGKAGHLGMQSILQSIIRAHFHIDICSGQGLTASPRCG